MKNRKGFALIISLVLVIGVVLPGTLALSTDQAATNGELTVTEETPTPTPEVTETPTPTPEVTETPTPTEEPKPTETPVPSETEKPAETEAPKECTCSAAEGEAHIEGCSLYVAPEQPAEAEKTCTCDPAPAEGEAHKEGCPLYVAPEQPAEAEKTCTCDPAPAEGEAHKEGCPLYVAPEKPAEAEKTCTCDPAPAEGEAHKEGCPLYVAPEKPADPSHIDTCSDDCTDAECKCPCHLMKKIMECKTLEEIEAIIKATPEDVLKSLSEEQVAQVEAYMDKLMPAPLPAIVIEESEPPVESEIYRPTVNYTNVAPFGDPVTGGNN